MLRVLEPALATQLAETRELLAAVRDALIDFGAVGPDQAALAASMRQLDDLFLLVVVGEFNAGKSAFINALRRPERRSRRGSRRRRRRFTC